VSRCLICMSIRSAVGGLACGGLNVLSAVKGGGLWRCLKPRRALGWSTSRKRKSFQVMLSGEINFLWYLS